MTPVAPPVPTPMYLGCRHSLIMATVNSLKHMTNALPHPDGSKWL